MPRKRRALAEAAIRLYPADLRAAGIGGRADVAVLVDAEGVVTRAHIARSSGQVRLDSAAIEAARSAQFDPATKGGCPVPFFAILPVVFSPGME